MDLLDQTLSSGVHGCYFEVAATVAIATYHRSRWDGLMARSHPQHKLARSYLARAFKAATRYHEQMGSAFIESLEGLEQWCREAGDVHHAEVMRLERQNWIRVHSLLIECDAQCNTSLNQ